MLCVSSNETAISRWDRPSPPLIGNLTRCVVAGQFRDASCVTLACVPLEYELSNQTNPALAKDGKAHRNHKVAASQTSRPRRRRCRPPSGYLSIRQLAEQADAALSSAYSWVETGKLPASQWRGIIVVAETDADEFLAVRPLRSADANGQEARHG